MKSKLEKIHFLQFKLNLLFFLTFFAFFVFKFDRLWASDSVNFFSADCIGQTGNKIYCNGPGVSGGGRSENIDLEIIRLIDDNSEQNLKFHLKRFLESALENIATNSQAHSNQSQMNRDLENNIHLILENDLDGLYFADLQSPACKEIIRSLKLPFEFEKPEAFTYFGEPHSPICFDKELIRQNLLKDNNFVDLNTDEELILLKLISLALHEHRHHFQNKLSQDASIDFVRKLETEAQYFQFTVLSLAYGRNSENPTFLKELTPSEFFEKYKDTSWSLLNLDEKRKILAEVNQTLARLNEQLTTEVEKSKKEIDKADSAKKVMLTIFAIVSLIVAVIAFIPAVAAYLSGTAILLMILGGTTVYSEIEHWHFQQVLNAKKISVQLQNYQTGLLNYKSKIDGKPIQKP